MSTIILTSTAYRVIPLCVSELKLNPPDHEVVLINTACNLYVQKGKPTPWLEKDRKSLIDAGFRVKEIDIAGMKKEEIESLFKETSIVFVAGGNAFYLLHEMRKSGALEVIKPLVTSGKLIYIGSSAGSVIAAQNAQYAVSTGKLNDIADLTDFSALGLVDIEPWVHIGQEDYDKLKKRVAQFIDQYATSSKKVLLRNDQALIVKDGWMKFIQSTL